MMTEELKQKLIEILTYFKSGMDNIEASCDERQPMQDEMDYALPLVKKLVIHGVVKSLPSNEVINYLERQEDFYIDEDEIANRFYNAALNDVKYFIEKEEEKQK